MMMIKMIMLLWAAVGFNVNFSVYAVACSLEGKKKKRGVKKNGSNLPGFYKRGGHLLC